MNELSIGQRIRVTRHMLEPGVPARSARFVLESISEGVITKMKRSKESPNTIIVSYTDGHSDRTVCADIYMYGGLRLKDPNRSQEIEILQPPPCQQGLFDVVPQNKI